MLRNDSCRCKAHEHFPAKLSRWRLNEYTACKHWTKKKPSLIRVYIENSELKLSFVLLNYNSITFCTITDNKLNRKAKRTNGPTSTLVKIYVFILWRQGNKTANANLKQSPVPISLCKNVTMQVKKSATEESITRQNVCFCQAVSWVVFYTLQGRVREDKAQKAWLAAKKNVKSSWQILLYQ